MSKKRYLVTSTAFPNGVYWHGENEDEVFKATTARARQLGKVNANVMISPAMEEHEKDARIAELKSALAQLLKDYATLANGLVSQASINLARANAEKHIKAQDDDEPSGTGGWMSAR